MSLISKDNPTQNRVWAFQCAVNAFQRIEDDMKRGRSSRQDDLDLIRYALRSGFIKALMESALSEAEKADFDVAQAGQAIKVFTQEDKNNVY